MSPSAWPQSTLGPDSRPTMQSMGPALRVSCLCLTSKLLLKMVIAPSTYATIMWDWNSSRPATFLSGATRLVRSNVACSTTTTPLAEPTQSWSAMTARQRTWPGIWSTTVRTLVKVPVLLHHCQQRTEPSALPEIRISWCRSNAETPSECPLRVMSRPCWWKVRMLPLLRPQKIHSPACAIHQQASPNKTWSCGTSSKPCTFQRLRVLSRETV
mmetsp:Transcript_100679/g.194491  ORF Transcript_100679/g.194491 Transcript_100679/m.194491 type:complete len:213 (+) Transcript_100679:773-1411(+)